MTTARLLTALPLGLALLACQEPQFPCADEGSERRCDPGYICVKDTSPLGQIYKGREVCVRTGRLNVGDPCQTSEECQGFNDRTAVCADQRRDCPTGEESACDNRCRAVCIGHGDCGPDQICYPGGGDIPGVCQEGECGETRQDACPAGMECLWFKPGPSAGVCYAPCDILRQGECDRVPPPSDARCCAPQESCVHFSSNPQAASCLPEGRALLGENCDTEEQDGLSSCAQGLFCSDQLGCTVSSGNCHGQCMQYCVVTGGNPACDRGTCLSFLGGDGWTGYCQ